MNAILQVSDLTVDYGGNRAVHPTSIALAPGTLTCIAGANGAGKSSIVNSILGWSRGRSKIGGTVILDGTDFCFKSQNLGPVFA